MPHALYPVVIEYDDMAKAWSILAPDFPEVASHTGDAELIFDLATEAVLLAAEGCIEDGHALPAPTDLAAPGAAWPHGPAARIVHVPVPLASEPVRVNVSLDRTLLAHPARSHAGALAEPGEARAGKRSGIQERVSKTAR